MHRFRNIGVVIDLKRPNTDALAHAKELIDTNQATVYLLCMLTHAIDAHQQAAIEKSLREKAHFDFFLIYLTGKPVIEITRYSAEKKLDMILIESDKDENKLNRFFKGSLSLSLMREVACPVWVVKKAVSKAYQRILIAVGPEKEEEKEKAEAALNDKLIEIGTSYAKRQLAECYLVTVWRLEGESMLEGPFIKTPPEELGRLKDECKAEFAQAFEQLQRRHREVLTDCQTYMLHGEPGNCIAKFVAENDIDLIVMGTLARAGIQGFLIGNTAETIINQVDCSIMAIKPDGFVSPILF